MNYKLVSSKQIIAKVFRDLKPDSASFVADALEWIGEALEFIGVYSGLEHSYQDIYIENHRGAIPCDLHLVSTVEYEGMPLNYGSDVRIHALDTDNDAMLNPNMSSDLQAVFMADPNGGNQASFKQVATSREGDQEFYILENGVVKTSFECGTVRIHYMRLPVDEDNFPKVPDNVTAKEAITWYILRQMVMGGFKHPIFSWDFCDAKWEAYCGKAQNDLMFPSVDKVESFRNMWVNMIPNVNLYNNFFEGK